MLYANGNWDLTAVQTILAIGVFCEDRTLFEDALRFAAAGAGNGSVPHRIVTDAGQGQESGRDQGHEQLAVGLLADAAQVAWNQGVDLYGFDGNRILANVEYAARYNLGDDVPFIPDLDRTGKYIKTAVSDKAAAPCRPIYEMAYAHYAGVRGLDTPYTKAAVFRGTGGARVVEGSNDDLPSWGTFTYAGTTAPVRRPCPRRPAGRHAPPATARSVTVAWLPSAGASTATRVRRATRPDGPVRDSSPTGLDQAHVHGPPARARAGPTTTRSAPPTPWARSGDSARPAATAGLPGPLVDPRRRATSRDPRLAPSSTASGSCWRRAGTADAYRTRPPAAARRRHGHRADRVAAQLPVLQDRRHRPRLPRRGRRRTPRC